MSDRVEVVALEEWAEHWCFEAGLRAEACGFLRRQAPNGIIWWEWPHGVPLRVLVSARKEKDGRRWAHISMSHRDNRLPSWDQVKRVRDVFLGTDKRALQVLAPTSEWYSKWEVLHLWYAIDGDDGLPDFREPDADGEMRI